MTSLLHTILGPRVPEHELARRGVRYRTPTALLWLARLALLVSIFLPYWKMKLEAPQYPRGLHVQAFVNRLTGDVKEIDGLNHYIGMRPLEQAAQLERSLSVAAIIALVLLMEAAVSVHTKWAALLVLPAVVFPAFFLLDLHFWLAHFGQNLDPAAPLSKAVTPFTPPLLGEGNVGQFKTITWAGPGLILATAGSLLALVALYFHRRAYKPLVDAERSSDGATKPTGPRGRSGRSDAGKAGVGAAVLAGTLTLGARGADFDLRKAIEDAPPGQVLEVPAGIYSGTIMIDKPLSLVARGEAVLDGGGGGDVLEITAPDVTVRGFRIRHTGTSLDRENAGIVVLAPRATLENNVLEDVLFGIYLKGAADSVVRGNTVGGKDLPVQRRGDGIRIWQSDRTLIEGNTLHEVRDAVMWYSADVQVRRNRITNGRYGLHFMYSNANVLEENHLEGNSVGAFIMYSRGLVMRRNVFAYNRGPSGYGVGLKDVDGCTGEDNLFIGNCVGLRFDGSPSSLQVTQHFVRNVFAYNDVGLAFMPAVKRNVFSDNAFIDNLEQVAVLGSGTFAGNQFTLEGRGNFWSDYRGYDADGDGIGDLPYRADSLFENLMVRQPRLRLFLYSPAQQAVDLAARAFPLVKPQPKVSDEAPLMAAVPLAIAPRLPRSPWPMLAVAALLVGGAVGTMSGGRWSCPMAAPGPEGAGGGP